MSKKVEKIDLVKKLARLESINDQLMSELAYVDRLMRQVGFSEGLESLKSTAQELFESEFDENDQIDAA
jgi:hypothetical protein